MSFHRTRTVTCQHPQALSCGATSTGQFDNLETLATQARKTSYAGEQA